MILPDRFWTRIKNIQRIHQRLYNAGLGWVVGWMILLLEHSGRKSGKSYSTPLQYELIDGQYYVGAGRGPHADWYKNILVNKNIRFQVGKLAFSGWAEPVSDPQRVVNFLQYRFHKHPVMMGLMMKFHKLPTRPSQSQLFDLAKTLAVVILHPVDPLSK